MAAPLERLIRRIRGAAQRVKGARANAAEQAPTKREMTRFELHRLYAKNCAAVNIGMQRTGLVLRQAISSGDQKTEDALTRLYALTLAIWAESRLLVLLDEKRAFGRVPRKVILKEKTQLEKWKGTVRMAFRKRYKVKTISLLPFSQKKQYEEIAAMLDRDLGPCIELRNRLAHGQWYVAISADGAVNDTLTAAIRKENLLSLQYKRLLLEHIVDVIQTLVLWTRDFPVQFDAKYEAIVHVRTLLERKEFRRYRNMMEEKYKRGKVKAQERVVVPGEAKGDQSA